MTLERNQIVTETLQQAIDLAPVERRPFLTRACQGDAALIAEIESLLEHHSLAEDECFLDSIPAAIVACLAGNGASNEIQTVEPSSTPEKIGRFAVLERLGQGTFGTVYLAEDEELGRKVAIKVPHPDRFNSDSAARDFVEEARTAAKLDHPRIVPVYDVGRQDDGSVFVVMKHIDAQSLRELTKSERVSQNRAADLISKVAEAIEIAHDRGFVHRDLKPANILLDADGQPHVADFGLAVHEDERALHVGEFAGTPDYMAPEQVRGEAHKLDGRTDIWALGIIFYELLTGRRPFSGRDCGEVADQILHCNPKSPRQVDPGIAIELERICLKCCAVALSGSLIVTQTPRKSSTICSVGKRATKRRSRGIGPCCDTVRFSRACLPLF